MHDLPCNNWWKLFHVEVAETNLAVPGDEAGDRWEAVGGRLQAGGPRQTQGKEYSQPTC